MQNRQLERQQESEEEHLSPELLARYFKFYRQYLDSNIITKIDFSKIVYQSFYGKYRKLFDKLAKICEKYKISHDKYIKFYVLDLKNYTPDNILNIHNIVLYTYKLKEDEQYLNIYKYFIKSANNIADECIRLKVTPVEYLRYLVSENKLAYEYFCGNISKYYLASIQNFKDVYERLDEINKQELSIIYDAYEELNNALQDAFLRFKNQRVKPIRFTEQLLSKKLLKLKRNNQIKETKYVYIDENVRNA